MILVDVAGAAPVPWKNGGGVTRELLKLPADAGADDWTLRISVADIDADGPFSPFPGISRCFAVLTGAGVRLRWPARAQHVHVGDAPLHFDGADAPDCTLFDGPTRDLNVMVRQRHATAEVTLANVADEAWPGHALGLGFFALRPVVLHGADDQPVTMPALSLAFAHVPADRLLPARAWRVQDNDGALAHTVPGYWIRLLPGPR